MRPNISAPAAFNCSVESCSSSLPQTSSCQEMSRFGPSTIPSSVIIFHMINLAILGSLTAFVLQLVASWRNRCNNASGFFVAVYATFPDTAHDRAKTLRLPDQPHARGGRRQMEPVD